jgi:hypothetical protein
MDQTMLLPVVGQPKVGWEFVPLALNIVCGWFEEDKI